MSRDLSIVLFGHAEVPRARALLLRIGTRADSGTASDSLSQLTDSIRVCVTMEIAQAGPQDDGVSADGLKASSAPENEPNASPSSSSSSSSSSAAVKYDEEEEEEDVCRICRNPGEPDNQLRYPCACSGSIKFVHQACLLQWLNHSNARQCEVRLHSSPRSDSQFAKFC